MAKDILVKFIIKDDGTIALQKIGNQSEKTTNEMKADTKKVNDGWGDIKKQILGAVAVYASFSTILSASKTMIEFQKQVANVSTLMDGLTVDTRELEDELLSMASTLGKTPTELTEGLYQVISAGIMDAADAMVVLEISAKASIAGLTTTFVAVDAITSTLNAYGLEVSEASRVSDIFFTTVKYGKITFEQLASSIGQVLPFTSQLGLKLEEVGGILATVTAAGLSPEIAMTALRALSMSFIQQSDIWKKAGVDIMKVLSEEGIIGAMQRLKEITKGDIIAMTEFIPETRALTIGLSLVGESMDEVVKNTQRMYDEIGNTDIAFKKMEGTVAHMLETLKSNFNVAVIKLGNDSLPVLEAVLKGLNATLIFFSDHIETISTGIKAFIGVVSAMALVLTIEAIPAIIASISAFTAAGATLTLTVPQFLLIATAISAVVVAMMKLGEWLNKKFPTDTMKENTEGMEQFAEATENVAWAEEKRKKQLGGFGLTVKELVSAQKQGIIVMKEGSNGYKTWFKVASGEEWDKVNKRWIVLNQLGEVSVKNTEEMIDGYKKLTEVIKTAGKEHDSIAKDNFSDVLKDDTKSVSEMRLALELYQNSISVSSNMRIDLLNTLKAEIDLNKELTEQSVSNAKARLASEELYYGKLISMSESSAKKIEESEKKILDIRTKMASINKTVANINFELEMKGIQDPAEVLSRRKENLEDSFTEAMRLEGQAKIDALMEYIRNNTALADSTKSVIEETISRNTEVLELIKMESTRMEELEVAKKEKEMTKQTEILSQIEEMKNKIIATKAEVSLLSDELWRLNTQVDINLSTIQAQNKMSALQSELNAIFNKTYVINVVTNNSSSGSPTPSYAIGTSYVPKTGLALIHAGERIIPASENSILTRAGIFNDTPSSIAPIKLNTEVASNSSNSNSNMENNFYITESNNPEATAKAVERILANRSLNGRNNLVVKTRYNKTASLLS